MESFQIIVTVASVVFSAGILYGKISSMDKKIDRMEKTTERVTKLEVEVKNIKEKLC